MRILGRLFVFLTAIPALVAADAPESVVQARGSLLPEGVLNAGIETAGNVTDGQFSVFLPLRSTLGDNGLLSGSLVFAEPYGSWIERGAAQAGVGLGARHLFSGQPVSAFSDHSPRVAGFMDEGWYVGADMFVDMLETSNDVRYWQMGLGAEIGTRYLELRGHYYLPLTNGETTYHSSTATFHSSSDIALNGGGRITADSLTTERFSTELLHESLEGWDVETAALVPWLDQWVDLKLVGGYASFHSTSLDAIQYDSWKAGAELRPFPACVISATWYGNERLVGDHWMYGIRLELPFETADIGDGKGGFWGHIKDAFKPRRRHLAERLYESAHSRHQEPQIAVYPKKSTLEINNRFREALILPDGTVLSYRERSHFIAQQTTGGNGTSTTVSATTVNNAGTGGSSGIVKTSGASLILSSSASYSGAVTISAGTIASSAGNTTGGTITNTVAGSQSTGGAAGSLMVGANSPANTDVVPVPGGILNIFDWGGTPSNNATNTMLGSGTFDTSGSGNLVLGYGQNNLTQQSPSTTPAQP